MKYRPKKHKNTEVQGQLILPTIFLHGDIVGHNIMTMTLKALLPRDASTERGDATVSCPSVCPSVRPSVCNVQVPCSNRFELFETNFTAE